MWLSKEKKTNFQSFFPITLLSATQYACGDTMGGENVPKNHDKYENNFYPSVYIYVSLRSFRLSSIFYISDRNGGKVEFVSLSRFICKWSE